MQEWVHQELYTKAQRLTNAAGTIVSGVEVDPFGGETNPSFDTSSVNQRQRYTSYERDGNGGDEAQQRRYERWHSRFYQPDPADGSYDLTNPQSLNRYSYVENDPVSFTDPTGLFRAAPGIGTFVVTVGISGSDRLRDYYDAGNDGDFGWLSDGNLGNPGGGSDGDDGAIAEYNRNLAKADRDFENCVNKANIDRNTKRYEARSTFGVMSGAAVGIVAGAIAGAEISSTISGGTLSWAGAFAGGFGGGVVGTSTAVSSNIEKLNQSWRNFAGDVAKCASDWANNFPDSLSSGVHEREAIRAVTTGQPNRISAASRINWSSVNSLINRWWKP